MKDDNSLRHALRDRLRDSIPSDRFLDSDLWRDIYARDASYFDIRPLAIVRARSEKEVADVLAAARKMGVGVTFRAGGTSLSGQSVNNGIICEVRGGWRNSEIRDDGRKIWFEPGLTADQVNAILKPHHHHIGPDPASSKAAMMGGILSNNSSGMEAGVKHNSYHTVSSIKFMLADGKVYDSASPADRKRFAAEQRELCEGLLAIRREIMADDTIRSFIERKYRIKNVTGYAMNSFVDYSDPMDIFIHTLIGSEGTLAYILSAELNTLPLYDHYSSAMLYFPNVTEAAAQAAWLGEEGAIAVEMMDYASLRSVQGLRNDMPVGTTALLVDFGADSEEHLRALTSAAEPKIKAVKNIIGMDDFTTTVAARSALWSVRDGVFPCVAGVRPAGAAVVLEDVAAPVGDLDLLVNGIETLFRKHGYEGAIFGHARDGNIHPLVAAKIVSEAEKQNFRNFIEGFVDHVLSLEGSLKGEHGTGRAMAPFVEREWGEKIYSMMVRLKNLADPQRILNPGVIINDDPECFIRPMKTLDPFGEEVGYEHADKCMECGYCEHVCPSRDITLTPRQRLQAMRVIRHAPDEKTREALRREYSYIGRDTCASDGSCQLPCPMSINTAAVTDGVRRISNPALFDKALTWSASHYGSVEDVVKTMLRGAVAAGKVISPYPLIWATRFMHRLYRQIPHWSKHFPMPSKLHYNEISNPDWLYFPACVTRIFGASSLGKDDLITVVLRIAQRAGISVGVPRDFHGLCCSQIWEHKGDPKGHAIAANHTVEEFYRISDSGRIPIFCDTTSCTHTLLTLDGQKVLTEENKKRFAALRIIDITQWLTTEAMPRLKVVRKKGSVVLHPTCASRLQGLQPAMESIAAACAEKYLIPADTHCCGAAGDRGFMFPEVAHSATAPEKADIEGKEFDGYYSLARTCEISMMDTIGRPYESIIYLVDETTAPAD